MLLRVAPNGSLLKRNMDTIRIAPFIKKNQLENHSSTCHRFTVSFRFRHGPRTSPGTFITTPPWRFESPLFGRPLVLDLQRTPRALQPQLLGEATSRMFQAREREGHRQTERKTVKETLSCFKFNRRLQRRTSKLLSWCFGTQLLSYSQLYLEELQTALGERALAEEASSPQCRRRSLGSCRAHTKAPFPKRGTG